jgi:hypothetical protein
MLPLKGTAFPTSADSLRDALTGGLTQFGVKPREVVAAGPFPKLDELRIDLTGASAPADRPQVKPGQALSGEIEAQSLRLLGKPIKVADLPLELELQARDAHLREFSAEGADRILVLQRGAGRLHVEIGREELRQLLLAAGNKAAQQRGAEIKELKLDLTATDPRTVNLRAEVVAKFGFVKATLSLTGRAQLDDQLRLHLSNLDVQGSGLASSLAVGLIRPQLEKLQREPISLAALPLGALKLRDVRITTGARIRLEADFGG